MKMAPVVRSDGDKEKAKLTFSTPGTSSHQLCGEIMREAMGLLLEQSGRPSTVSIHTTIIN